MSETACDSTRGDRDKSRGKAGQLIVADGDADVREHLRENNGKTIDLVPGPPAPPSRSSVGRRPVRRVVRFFDVWHGRGLDLPIDKGLIVWLDYTDPTKIGQQMREFEALIDRLRAGDVVRVTVKLHRRSTDCDATRFLARVDKWTS